MRIFRLMCNSDTPQSTYLPQFDKVALKDWTRPHQLENIEETRTKMGRKKGVLINFKMKRNNNNKKKKVVTKLG